ncbi:APC family permease [Arthrobacter mobilis]|uniref:APC family permease n=1 Tax=Arthrobacter mobilis TaxID=2724944 RepID=A0A7X6K2E2_9MICC|nr:APC family permease [Arthrobacter mobilis]NKX53092.1 APC family permease [Arthrobacter mobilis]
MQPRLPETAAQSTRLSANTLGVGGIVFLVLAAVAPLTGIIVIATLGIALGNGGGMAGAFLIATVILLLFAVGYAQMSKKLVSAGGFYAFVVKGLGRPMGVVAGFIAMLGYNCFVAGAIGTSGFFTATVMKELTGIDLPWFAWSLVSVALVFLLTRRGIDVSAKVLGVCLVLEVSILVLLDFRILFSHGFSAEALLPQTVLSGSVGLALLFAANCFVGFEATGLFSEEAKDPRRTIPRATYIAILFIGIFAAFTTWAIVSALGVAQAQGTALEHLPTGDLVFMLSSQYLGDFLTKVMMVLLLVSLFAALLALHNSAARYIYAYGRVGILPAALGRTRSANGAPQNASAAQLVFGTLVAFIYFVAGLDPIAALTASMTGFGTLGILALQMLAAIAVVVHFRRSRDTRIWKTLVAPGIGALGLAAIVLLAIANFGTLAGSDSPVIGMLPWLLAVATVAGLATAHWLKTRRPQVYDELLRDMERYDQAEAAAGRGQAEPAASGPLA